MSRLPLQTAATAAEASRPYIDRAITNNGFLPNLIGVLANAPTALETYFTVGEINARGSLTLAEREVVQITAASLHGCEFCVSGHSALALKKAGLDAAAGFSPAQALEVVLGVSLATLCNFANNLAQSAINPQLQPLVYAER